MASWYISLSGAIEKVGEAFISLMGTIDKVVLDKDAALKIKTKIIILERRFSHLSQMAMINAKWAYPLTIITGTSLVLICLFDLTCAIAGWGTYRIQWQEDSLIVLLSMFIFCASGSAELLTSVVKLFIDRGTKKLGKPK